MKPSEYLWPKTKRLVKDERRSKSKLLVSGQFLDPEKSVITCKYSIASLLV